MKETHNFCPKCGVKKTEDEVGETQIEVEESVEERELPDHLAAMERWMNLNAKIKGLTDDELDPYTEKLKGILAKGNEMLDQYDNKLIDQDDLRKRGLDLLRCPVGCWVLSRKHNLRGPVVPVTGARFFIHPCFRLFGNVLVADYGSLESHPKLRRANTSKSTKIIVIDSAYMCGSSGVSVGVGLMYVSIRGPHASL